MSTWIAMSDSGVVDPLLDWGIEILRELERNRHPVLTGAFEWVTDLSGAGGYILLVPLVWWANSETTALRIIFVLTMSVWLNETLKAWTQIERPFTYADIRNLREAEGFSFPSGHAQTAGVFWTLLALLVQKRWVFVLATVMILSIGFSRLYLGVHYPHDVLVGWILGVGLAYGFWKSIPPLTEWLDRRTTAERVWMSLTVPVLFCLVHAERNIAISMGGLSGMTTGHLLRVFRNESAASVATDTPAHHVQPNHRVQRVLLGFAGILALLWIFRLGSPDDGSWWTLPYVFFSLFGVGLWVSWGVFRLTPASQDSNRQL